MRRFKIISMGLRLGLLAVLIAAAFHRSVPGNDLGVCSVAPQSTTPDPKAPTSPTESEIPVEEKLPILTAKLANDTGDNKTDCITSDPTILSIFDRDRLEAESVNSISAAINDDKPENFVELVPYSKDDGTVMWEGLDPPVDVFDFNKVKLRRVHLEEIAGRELSDGRYTVYIKIKNTSGETLSLLEVSFLLDTQAPQAVPENLDLLIVSDTGPSNSDNITNDNTPTLGGSLTAKGEPNMEIQLYKKKEDEDEDEEVEELIGTAIPRGDSWQATVKELPDGVQMIYAKAVDRAGNISGIVELELTIDTVDPALSFNGLEDDSFIMPKSQFAGVVDGSGSDIAALSYQFTNIFPMPLSKTAPISVPFVRPTGSFIETFNLEDLTAGFYHLSFLATDLAGNTTNMGFRVQVDLSVPFRIVDCSPANGAIDVGVTHTPQIFFSKAVNPATLNGENLFATFGGRKLATKIVPADNGRFAWLFFREPLPDASAIRVTVDGTSILPLEGEDALDADRDSGPGGVLSVDFSTVSLVPLPNTTITGILIDPGVDRLPNTSDDEPIVGASVFLIGLEEYAQYTGADGTFKLDAVPGGSTKLAIAPQKATNTQPNTYFPEIELNVNIAPGVENYVTPEKPEIFLPRLNKKILQQVDSNGVTRIVANEISAPELSPSQRQFLSLEVPPNSLLDSAGEKLNGGKVGISTISLELLPNILPPGIEQEAFMISIQAPGVSHFSSTMPISFPNLFDSPPGSSLHFVRFDSIAGQMVVEGSATVSDDGQSVRTDTGVGITRPGWHGLVPAKAVVVAKRFSHLPSRYGHMQRVRPQMGCVDSSRLRRR